METSIFRRLPRPTPLWKQVWPYGWAVLNSFAALGLSLLLQVPLQRTPLVLMYAAVFASSWLGGSGPGLAAVLLTVLLSGKFILRPDDLLVSITMDAVPLIFYTLVGLATVAVLTQLKERTAILREKERQLTDVMENTSVGLHWLSEDGTILWANRAQADLLGWRVEEYVGRQFQDFHVEPQDARDILRSLAGHDRLKNYETRLRAKDGSVKVVLLDADALWKEGRFVHARCFLRDLTTRQHMEEALRQSELRFRQLAENINVVFWLWSPADQQFLYVSEAYEKVWGRPCQSLLAAPLSFLDTVHPEDRAAVVVKIDAQNAGEFPALEYRILRPDGSLRWVKDQAFPLKNQAGVVYRIAGITEDVTERKQAELRVQENETKFRAIFENSLDAIGVVRAGRLVMVNPALLKLFGGASVETLAGQSILDLVPAAQHAVVADHEQRHTRGESVPASFQTRGVRRNGREFDLEVEVSGFRLHDQPHTLFILRDVTQRKQAEDALRKSETGLRLAQHIGRIGSWEADREKGTLTWSEETYRIFHCSPETFTPTAEKFFALVHPEDRERIRQVAGQNVREGDFQCLEYRIFALDGAERHIVQHAQVIQREHGQALLMVGTLQDITERKRVEVELRESEGRFRLLFERSPEAVFILDPHAAGGRLSIVDCNEAACRHHGYRREELLGQSLSVLDEREELPTEAEDFLARARQGEPVRFETLHRHKDGSSLIMESSVSLITLGQRELLLVMDRDITERKQAQEAVQKLNEQLEARVRTRTRQLEEANRELEAFSYSISHDLRAPVRAINGFTQIIQEDHGASLNEETTRLFKVIASSAQRMGELIEDLLAFSGLNARAPQSHRVNMMAVATAVVAELLPASDEASRRVVLHLQELPAARGDQSLLRQVFVNLIGNALKFSKGREQPIIEMGGRREGQEMIYFVKDNGVGFDMHYAGKLFKVFQRLHSLDQFEGTGIGLAIVQRIVLRHGGRVWAEGAPGAGATFYFALPAEDTSALQRAGELDQAGPAGAGRFP